MRTEPRPSRLLCFFCETGGVRTRRTWCVFSSFVVAHGSLMPMADASESPLASGVTVSNAPSERHSGFVGHTATFWSGACGHAGQGGACKKEDMDDMALPTTA